MNDQKKILEMLGAGKITVEEAEKLIGALGGKSSNEGNVKKVPEFMYVKVSPKGEKGDRVSVKIPFKLLRAGMKLAAFMPSSVQDKVQGHLEEKGVNIDLSKMSKENMDELLHTLSEFSVDVDGEDESVKIYCE
ncbi:MAG: hypothetical protein COW00_14180 [Bdellovibrio sp. CG12_big_fil_rev_8_21_14_0_65_39_13]|nr:MAG: hypothetical protein COW78_08075 [Bdellovibrio sp. CG22_combo_CG10-13_8_21_14_all_39_27]PIQ58761.1 MAG: hypothetical protein COW00_14180 [Bdellovibrio sp. CG12_big_fil_rev_8_21_14_0_65_39_13]PIR35558.1 MAG: hypothetical protein COV37_08780 [Bdellovibrio sp. CG11_big_fil_rev_8_21_14_0_20_39_38]PJB54312.1 MAG: hypothetical protein CO099_02340 [Bdellovibrio sp. CG_4_9_14_3_um_filter_39_7]